MEEIIVMETEGGIWPGYIGKISVLCLAKEINKIIFTRKIPRMWVVSNILK